MLLSSLAATVYKLVLSFSSSWTSVVFEVGLQQCFHEATRRMLTGDSTLMDLILSDALLQQSFDHEKS